MSPGTGLALRTTDPRVPRLTLWLSSAGLEATYLYAWAAFALTLVSNHRYSALLAVSTFAVASFTARALAPLSLRILELALLHAAAVTLVSLLSIHGLVYPSAAWWRLDLLTSDTSPRAWGTSALAVFFSGSLWRAGFRHGAEPSSYERVCGRFDRGVLWLGALFALKLLWRGQRDAHLDDGVSGSLIAPYFLFAVVAIAGARSRGMGAKSLIGGYRGLGRMANVSVGGVLVTLACVMLFLPELQNAARVSYETLRELDGPIGNVFAFVLYLLIALWMLIRGPHQAAPSLKEQIVFVDPKARHADHAVLPLQEPPSWFLWAVVIASLVSICVGACYVLWRLRKSAADSRNSLLAALWCRMKGLWLAWRQRVMRLLTAAPLQPEPVRIYAALLNWGRRSGSPHRPSETPLEYARRLERRLPALRAEIELIATTYCAHAYRPRSRSHRACSDERAALRRLRSLKLWPQRFKLCLTGDGDEMSVTHSLQDHTVSEAAS